MDTCVLNVWMEGNTKIAIWLLICLQRLVLYWLWIEYMWVKRRPHSWLHHMKEGSPYTNLISQSTDSSRTKSSQWHTACYIVHCGAREGWNPPLPWYPATKDDGSLNIMVYRKPPQTDQYLRFSSQCPLHVKRRLVKCLFKRTRGIAITKNNLWKEEEHMTHDTSSKTKQITPAFLSATPHSPHHHGMQRKIRRHSWKKQMGPHWWCYLIYIAGVSEDIRRVYMEVWYESSVQAWSYPSLDADQGEWHLSIECYFIRWHSLWREGCIASVRQHLGLVI